VHEVSSGYFDVLRIPVLAGHNFTATDATLQSIVINETMAKRYWPDGSPVGKTAIVNNTPRTIVGIVKDAYTSQLGSIEPTVYFPMDGFWMPQVLVRGGGKISVRMAGVFAYAVRQRTREIGIRIALGAEPRAVVRLVLGSSARAVATGLLVGLFMAAGSASRCCSVSRPSSPAWDPRAALRGLTRYARCGKSETHGRYSYRSAFIGSTREARRAGM
jgi:hypothetical protein